MEAVFLKIVNMSITAGWLVLAIGAVRLIFRKTPKWILCLLWALVALRLVCPVTPESALSLIPSPEPLPQEIIYTAHPVIQSGVGAVDAVVNPALEASMTPVTHAASANPTQIWSFLLSRVWVLGMAAMAVYALVSCWLLKRRVAAAIPMEKGIKECEFVDSPFVLGILRPVVYLPCGMTEADRAYVIAHEKAHIRRRDHWWKPIGFALLSVYWFHPLLWLAYILLCRDIEAACDEKVIRDMGREERQAYSRALLHCSIHRRRIAACPLAFGEVGVKARVRSVMDYKKPAFWLVLTALILCASMAVGFLTDPSGMHLYEINDSRNYSDLLTDMEDPALIIEGEEYPVRNETEILAALEEVMVRDVTLLRSRSEGRDKTHQIRLRENTYLNFSWNYSHVWIDNGMKPTYTYRVIHTAKVREIFNSIHGVNLRIDAADATSTGVKLVHKPEGVTSDADAVVNYDHWLERFDGTAWQRVNPMSGNHGDSINCLITADRDIHQLDWKTNYGTLPVGNYRIGQTIFFLDVSREHTVYTEFMVEEQVPCIFAEDVTATGLTLVYDPVEAFPDLTLQRYDDYWLEYWDGSKWMTQKALRKIKDYIEITPDGSGRQRLDWSGSYGALQPGTYRVAMECYFREKNETEYFYAPFAVDTTRKVTAWYDDLEGTATMQMRKWEAFYWPGLDGVKVEYMSSHDGERIIAKTDSGEETLVTGWPVRNAYFADLSGDGVPELCTTACEGFGIIDSRIRVYDYMEKQLYELEDRGVSNYELALRNDTLIVIQTDEESGGILEMGILALSEDKGMLRMDPLDNSFRGMTGTVSYVHIFGPRLTRIHDPEGIDSFLSALRALENAVTPATAQEMEEAKAYNFFYNGYSIIIHYELGEKELCFSEDFSLIWEAGAYTGYRINDPEPIRNLICNAVDGVIRRETEGTPFATMEEPWNWTAGISVPAVQDARMEACLERASDGLNTSTSNSAGVLTGEALEELLAVLNQIPKTAFTKGDMLVQESFFWYFVGLEYPGSSVYLIDAVNGLAAVVRYENGKIHMLLTDEVDNTDAVHSTYLKPTQLWVIEDASLTAYMQYLQQYHPMVTYTVGAEYNWQEPVTFTAGDFFMEVPLFEDWEYEMVNQKDSCGIRVRPKEAQEGWIYCSFWPGGYHPEEEGGYVETTANNGFDWITCWPESVESPDSFDYQQIWSYRLERYDQGDVAFINEGADSWFLKHEDEISDMIILAMFSHSLSH